MSSKTKYWDERVGKVFSATGGWQIGASVWSHGEDLHNVILPRDRYFEHLLRAATGQTQSPELARWVEGAFMTLSWPDPRIWCNYVGAMMGDLGCRPSSSTLMGTLASDSYMYGGGSSLGLIKSIRTIRQQRLEGYSAEEIVQQHLSANRGKLRLMGYSRPLATGDERVAVLIKLARRLGLAKGEHEAAALEIDAYLVETMGESLNAGGIIAVMMADHNIDDQSFYRLFSLCTMAGVMACHRDAAARPQHSFMPMPVSEVEYTGKTKRSVPSG